MRAQVPRVLPARDRHNGSDNLSGVPFTSTYVRRVKDLRRLIFPGNDRVTVDHVARIKKESVSDPQGSTIQADEFQEAILL
jgi:hypothetical protein